MKKQEEIKIVMQLTQADKKQILINEIGWTSRIYLVDDGRFVFKFPRNKEGKADLNHEINVLKSIEGHDFNLKTPVVKWCGERSDYVGFLGVPGEALSPEAMKFISNTQKETLGKQLGIFLKKLHSVNGVGNLGGNEEDQTSEYQEKYRENRNVFEQYFNTDELAFVDELFLKTALSRIKELGKDIVFCHGDFGYNNILLDSNMTAGVIDFGDAGFNDRSIDFVDLDDATVLNAALEAYGDDMVLREKIAIRQKIFPIFLMLFYIDKKDSKGIGQCVEKIRLLKTLESL